MHHRHSVHLRQTWTVLCIKSQMRQGRSHDWYQRVMVNITGLCMEGIDFMELTVTLNLIFS